MALVGGAAGHATPTCVHHHRAGDGGPRPRSVRRARGTPGGGRTTHAVGGTGLAPRLARHDRVTRRRPRPFPRRLLDPPPRAAPAARFGTSVLHSADGGFPTASPPTL